MTPGLRFHYTPTTRCQAPYPLHLASECVPSARTHRGAALRAYAGLFPLHRLRLAAGLGGRPYEPGCRLTSMWCPRSESNRHAFKGGGFSCHFGFRRPEGITARVRGLEHAITMA